MSDAFQGKFSLFPAKEKKSEKSPDHTGSVEFPVSEAMKLAEWITAQPGEANWNGEQVIKIRIAGWASESKNGLSYIRGSMSPPQPQQAAPANTAETDLF